MENPYYILQFDEWMELPVDGWDSTGAMIEAAALENGSTRELDFDMEQYQWEVYADYYRNAELRNAEKRKLACKK